VVWCDMENEPPDEVFNHVSGKVLVEKHDKNSLNERFHILGDPEDLPTYGILSVDDDVLRPCQAVDAGFFRWTRNPHRMVGYDTRIHVPVVVTTETGEEEDGVEQHQQQSEELVTWDYGALSMAQKSHRYSMALTRFCFIHKDYMELYYETLPSDILDTITENLNCEDIAMTLLISSRTGGKPPLLANAWARKTQIKLYQENAISGGDDIEKQEEHRRLRNACMDRFATHLNLKPSSQSSSKAGNESEQQHQSLASYDYVEWDKTMKPYFADEESAVIADGDINDLRSEREIDLVTEWQQHVKDKTTSSMIKEWVEEARKEARESGLIQKTSEWRQRFEQNQQLKQ
jgi:glucuronyl/N-acetylglucosaminyl transferase EXT2